MSTTTKAEQSVLVQVVTKYYRYFMRSLYSQRPLSFFIVFLATLGALKLNQFLLFEFNSSPAVILMPTGIMIASIYLGGYRMWVPVFLAWVLSGLTSPFNPSIVVVCVIAVAYTVQALIGAYLLNKFKFLGTLGRTRDSFILLGIALLVPALAPTVTTLVQNLLDALTVSMWESWSRAWAGGVLSIIVFTPLITTWYKQRTKKTKIQLIETLLALVALVVMTYLIFWTTLPQLNIFISLYIFFGVLFWIGLRMRPRIVATAIFIVSAVGMAGSIIAHPNPAVALNAQLFADELFIILIAPIFYILTALVEERKVSAQEALMRAEKLQEVNQKLSQEDDAKNQFLATLAHELRNPLAPVMSSLELMKIKARERNEADTEELVDIAITHNITLIKLIDDLLELSRISRNKVQLKIKTIRLEEVVAQAMRTVESLYNAQGHTLSVSMPEVVVWVNADPLRLEQILVNLLNNAAKYTPKGGRVVLDIVYNPQKGLRVSITDNGIGIEPGMKSKIFEAFVQTAEGSSGLGIGLSLTKRLVELHGGTIWVESEGKGRGSEFIFVLPASSVQTQPAAEHERRFISNEENLGMKTYKILVVDDNRAAALGLSKLLEYSGHTVEVAYDGEDAIEKLKRFDADVALLDIGLPGGMDGYSLARYLRKIYGERLYLIALTGYGQEDDKEAAREAGFNHHLTKPVSIQDIREVLALLQ
jgi:signal transduction histidine kinase